MNKYQNGKIYSIRNYQDDDFYIGSTCESLSKRLYDHKRACKHRNHMNLYKKVNQSNWDNFYIELIENYSCNNKNELLKREGELIREMKPTLNKLIPTGTSTRKEYYQVVRDKIVQNAKNYYHNNNEKIKTRRRLHRANNLDDYREQERLRYHLIRGKQAKEIIKCDCGANVSKGWLREHKKTKKHKEQIKTEY